MQKIIYTHTDSGQSWDHRLPRVICIDDHSIMGITESNMAQFGIVKTVVDLPDPPQPEPTAPRKVTPAGRVSVTPTVKASSGPALTRARV